MFDSWLDPTHGSAVRPWPSFPSTCRLTPRASAHLDAIRAAAAFGVMVNHLRKLFFVGDSTFHGKTAILGFVYMMTGLGHQCVMIFFVLSGFLIGRSVVESFRAGKWSWWKYAVSRLTRLELVLIPAILLGAVFDSLGWRVFAPLYYQPVPPFAARPFIAHLSAMVGIGNCIFLQGIALPMLRTVPTFGSNGPLWSLSYEFWYYVLFPLVMFAFRAEGRLRAAYIVCVLAIMGFVGAEISVYFSMWLMGVLIALAPDLLNERNLLRPFQVGAGAFLAAAVALAYLGVVPLMLSDFGVALGFTALLYGIVHSEQLDPSEWYRKISRSSAGFSYTLYLVHFPLLMFMCALLNPARSWQPDFEHVLAACAIASVVMAYAYFVGQFTEARTEQVRNLIMGYYASATAALSFNRAAATK